MQSEAYFVLLPPDTLCGCLMCILPGIWEYLFNIGMITSLTVLTLKNAELFQNVLIIDGQSSKGKRYLAWCGIPADVTWGCWWWGFNAHDKFAANKIVRGSDFTLGYVDLN